LLEKEIKKLRAEKIDYEAKFEERLFFIENKAKEKKSQLKKQYQDEIFDLRLVKSKLEESNNKLKEQLKFGKPGGIPPPESTGPPIPPRPNDNVKGSNPPMPQRQPPSKTTSTDKKSNQPDPNLSLGFPSPQNLSQTTPNIKFRYDFWESTNKLIVAFDVPGTEVELLDIFITRLQVIISRKVGQFEEKFFGTKYRPIQLWRHDQPKPHVVKDTITLPCAVQPNKKQAFHHHGTVFLQLDKLPDSGGGSLGGSDWQTSPTF